MELPPGWRGYGAKDYIDHPETPKRQAEVEQIKGSMNGADRFAVQAALMPYDHLLPTCFQGRNERLQEKLP
jgi:fumarate reductase flavoprotein subunit